MNSLKKIIQSFNYAFKGIVFTFSTQKNMRLHCLAAFFVLCYGYYLHFSKIKMIILLATITSVIVAEMINTSIEVVVDLITEEYHPLAEIAKDVAAGAVLITALNALIVGYLLFF